MPKLRQKLTTEQLEQRIERIRDGNKKASKIYYQQNKEQIRKRNLKRYYDNKKMQ